MFRFYQWLRRWSKASCRPACVLQPTRLELERLDDRILLSAPAVIDYPGVSVTHENVFVVGTDGNLYMDDWNGAKWTWVERGNDGASLS